MKVLKTSYLEQLSGGRPRLRCRMLGPQPIGEPIALFPGKWPLFLSLCLFHRISPTFKPEGVEIPDPNPLF